MAKSCWYSVPEVCDESRYQLQLAYEYDLDRAYEQQDAAELAADDFYNKHSGYECRWPAEIAIFKTENGPEIARFIVQMDMSPTFSGTLKN